MVRPTIKFKDGFSPYQNWFVYELIDPRTNTVFYIGKTCKPASRFHSHKTDPGSSAYSRIQEIEQGGSSATMKIVGKFSQEQECLNYEAHLIRTTPGLVNRAQRTKQHLNPPRAPSEELFDRRVPMFDGVLQVKDAMAIWRRVTGRDRLIMDGLYLSKRSIKRILGYPITWIYYDASHKPVPCPMKTVERLNRLGLIRQSDHLREFRITPLGLYVVKNARLYFYREGEIKRAA